MRIDSIAVHRSAAAPGDSSVPDPTLGDGLVDVLAEAQLAVLMEA